MRLVLICVSFQTLLNLNVTLVSTSISLALVTHSWLHHVAIFFTSLSYMLRFWVHFTQRWVLILSDITGTPWVSRGSDFTYNEDSKFGSWKCQAFICWAVSKTLGKQLFRKACLIACLEDERNSCMVQWPSLCLWQLENFCSCCACGLYSPACCQFRYTWKLSGAFLLC